MTQTINSIQARIESNELEFDSNYPGGAYYDHETDTHYNRYGQELRPIGDYDPYSPGYTPFGDE